MLPAWLGVGHALQALFKQGHLAELQAMYEEWPFFTSTFDLIEMARPPQLAMPSLAAASACTLYLSRRRKFATKQSRVPVPAP